MISCKFERCKANTKPSESGSTDFGGSAIYFQVVNGLINDCIFLNNNGNMIKVDTNFDRFSIRILKSDEIETTSLSINNCVFDVEQLSFSSIFYLKGENEVPLEVKECNFKGILKNETHYIDGISSKMNDKSKIRVKSSKFESDLESAVNVNKLGLLSNSNDDHLHQLNNKKSDKLNSNYVIILTISCIAIIVTIVALIIFVNEKNEKEINSA